MIEVTKLNDEKVTVNADLIEMIEEVPETVITFTNGKKIFVKESRQKVKNLVILYRMEIFNPTLEKEM
ncbi:MAG: flagellar FlbD family protein [Lachnospiraceae bacterium]|jgi:flagellar protein FlbD|nr:flagellar FlbD family protein [Lachnospiraceae bacterium]